MKSVLSGFGFFLFSMVVLADLGGEQSFARIVCQEGDSQRRPLDRVVIIEQLDASEEAGKDLIDPHKFYNSKEVSFAVTIYENATLESPDKSLDQIVHELKNRQKKPDYIGAATHNGRVLTFFYNRMEVNIRMELTKLDSVPFFRPEGSFPMSCKKPMLFQKDEPVARDGVVGEVCDLGKDPDCVPIVEE